MKLPSKVALHSGAERDLDEAFAFYAVQGGPKLASRFLDEFLRAAELLANRPSLGTPTIRGYRTHPLHVFPFSLVYREMPDGLLILVVRHQSRRPGYGSARR